MAPLKTGRRAADDEGIELLQGKAGAGVLVEWTDQLKNTVERAKALKPQVPGEYLLRKHNGKRYTARGFSAILATING